MKRIFFYPLVFILSVVAAYHVLSTWRGVSLFRAHPSEKVFFKALQFSSLNPDAFYGLGLFYQWDIRHIDLKKSHYYFSKALERNPLDQAYWINLAKVLQRMGEKSNFEKALENVIKVYPASYSGRWVTGSLLLQEGALEKALPHFSYILRHYPEQSNLVYELWSKVINDPTFTLERLVPNEPASWSRYLSYLQEVGDMESLRIVWQKVISLGHKPDRNETLRHIEFLISHGEPGEAFEIWKATLREEGLAVPSDGNLVTNGGYESDQILRGGFDWKMDNVSGAKISFDSSTAFEGKRSLRIAFDGKENIDFHHVYQLVPLKPNTDYLLTAYVKTRGVTTKSGPKLEIYGNESTFYAVSPSLTGDHEWKELKLPFRTTAQTRTGVVRVRREKTEKFDRLISGTVWLDHLQLQETKK